MRELVYLAGGLELTDYKRAREMQPYGQIAVRLDSIYEPNKGNAERYAKVRECFKKQKEAVVQPPTFARSEQTFDKIFFKKVLTNIR